MQTTNKKTMKVSMATRLLMVGKGRIGGTYCDTFWAFNSEGRTGYQCCRYPFAEEIPLILADLARHRKQLRKELQELAEAERLLKRAEQDPNYRAITPAGYK
jgi:hypothetical protein